MSVLKESCELFGFSPIETPIFERYETLAAKFAAGEDSDCMQEVYEKNTIHRNLDVNLLLTPVTEMTVKSFLECDYGLDK